MLKYILDYIPELQKQFPNILKEDLRRMASYGWRMFYYYNLRGCDTLFESKKYDFWMYCGLLNVDSILHFKYYKRMLLRKIRALFLKKHILWDGYYYTAISEEEYNKYFTKIKGRKRKNFTFNNKLCFKISDEAKLFFSNNKYIIRFKYIIDMGYMFKKDKLNCINAEIYFKRSSPAKFKDIIINENNYKYV